MPWPRQHLPKYRKHRASGQAIVTLGGEDHYLGPHGTKASKLKYDQLVTDYIANGRRSPKAVEAETTSVGEVILAFWRHAKRHYRKADGRPTSELSNYKRILKLLRDRCSAMPVVDFGPKTLKAIRESMIALGWSRKSINHQVRRIRSMFRWATEEELIPPSVYHGLQAVRGLQKGRTEAPESQPIRPVPTELIDPIEPFVSRQVWAMVQLQLLSGARAGEIVNLRPREIDTSDAALWICRPEEHKTAHHDHEHLIYFGPRAQAVLTPFLEGRDPDAFVFSPIEAEVERRAAVHASRRTPLNHGNRPGTNRSAAPRRQPTESYDVSSYRRAIQRACDLAFPPPAELARGRKPGKKGTRAETDNEWKSRLGAKKWAQLREWQRQRRWHPHQLRHNAATNIRREFGIEMARVVLGHRSLDVTEIYAELNVAKAREAMAAMG